MVFTVVFMLYFFIYLSYENFYLLEFKWIIRKKKTERSINTSFFFERVREIKDLDVLRTMKMYFKCVINDYLILV